MHRESTPVGIEVKMAHKEQAQAVAAIRTSAAKWLEDHHKLNDWPIPYPINSILEAISAKVIYVAHMPPDSSLVATITLQWSDANNWGRKPPDAGYVHGLAVLPELMGRGIGTAMLDWADQKILARSRQYLRLDCFFENLELRNYYESLGFE